MFLWRFFAAHVNTQISDKFWHFNVSKIWKCTHYVPVNNRCIFYRCMPLHVRQTIRRVVFDTECTVPHECMDRTHRYTASNRESPAVEELWSLCRWMLPWSTFSPGSPGTKRGSRRAVHDSPCNGGSYASTIASLTPEAIWRLPLIVDSSTFRCRRPPRAWPGQ